MLLGRLDDHLERVAPEQQRLLRPDAQIVRLRLQPLEQIAHRTAGRLDLDVGQLFGDPDW
jgi:hypothetical protein